MRTKPHILLISSKSSQYGGVEDHCLDLIKCFSPSCFVTIMCPAGPLCEEYKKAGAEVIIKVPSTPYDFSFAFFVKSFCKKNSVKVVHAHELISAQGLFGAFLARVPKRIWHVHTPFLFWKHKNIITKAIKTIPNFITNFFVANLFATDVLALTESIKRHRKFSELVFNKISVIPNGRDISIFTKKIDVSKFKSQNKFPNDRIIIGNLSRTSQEKGQIYLCEAFKKLNENFPKKYFLLLCGGGELESDLRNYCEKNFPGVYAITGRFEENDKAYFLKSMDYFVFPSLAEGFGYTPLEALSSGLLVLSSDIEVLKSVLKKSVLYFESKNSESLYTNLIKLMSLSNSEREVLKNNASKILENYSMELFCKNYTKLYGL